MRQCVLLGGIMNETELTFACQIVKVSSVTVAKNCPLREACIEIMPSWMGRLALLFLLLCWCGESPRAGSLLKLRGESSLLSSPEISSGSGTSDVSTLSSLAWT